MHPRPLIALVLYQLIFGALQLIGYNCHGWLSLLAAWFVIMIATLIDTRGTFYKVFQVVVQTVWFIFLLTGVNPGDLSLSFLKSIGQ